MQKRKLILLLLLFIISIKPGFTQTVQNLVFEGAGMRGIAYAGAITELENRNIIPNVKRVAGTSAGAITALMVSLNYNAEEIAEIISNTNFKRFNNGKFLFAGGLVRTMKYFGWYRSKRFDKWLSNIIEEKAGSANITFLQLKQAGFKDLYVTGTSLNNQKSYVFSYEHYPQMKVKDAVRISMSIPLYFEAVFMDDTGNIIQHPKNKNGLHIMVDGGFTANFPITVFDSTKYLKEGENKFEANIQTLGFRIDRDEQIAYDTAGKYELAPFVISDIQQYTKAFYSIIIENLNRHKLTEADWQRTVSISDANIGPRIKKLKKSQLESLIKNGQTATEKYFAKPN